MTFFVVIFTQKHKPAVFTMLNANRTDLRLLLECLKYQMKCPASQKQALLTVVSICQQNSGQNIEFLGEIGGVTFIYNLSRASDYSEVKETALFTLSSLAEVNESCKQSLCREEMFCGLADCMEQEESLTLKRVAVYLLCVLVSNNKQGQSFVRTSRCIDVLLNLFRSTYPMAEGTNELLQLWTSVSSALCGCVNNPQNEENQCACMCVLPLVKVWLQQVSMFRVELAQPICSFISMTVANNSCVQEYFASVGGLLTLSDTLSSAVTQCRENPEACKLAAMITRTLSACITDNEALAPVLSELMLVPHLLLLLSSPNLSPRDQLAVVLTLGCCTDACVEHQVELLRGGGLPLVISLLIDANDEEVRKAATFVLQTCQKLTGSIAGQSVESDLQRHRQSAWEIGQRIQQLERSQLDNLGKGVENSSAQITECREELWEDSVVRKGSGRNGESRREDIPQNFTPPTQCPPQPVTVQGLGNQQPMQHVRRQIVKDFDKSVNHFQRRNGEQQRMAENVLGSSVAEQKREQLMRRESGMKNRGMEEMERGETSATNLNRDRSTDDLGDENFDSATHTKLPGAKDQDVCSPDVFKHPAPMKRHQQAPFGSEDELSVCSELLDSEIERILFTPAASKPSKLRCAGCVSGMDEVNSRTVGVVLRSCKSRCEFHLVLQRAEDRLKRSLRISGVTHGRDHTRDHGVRDPCSSETVSKHIMKEREGHTNRPNHRDAMRLITLTPLKRSGSDMQNRHVSDLQKPGGGDGMQSSSARQSDRKYYSGEEIKYLSEGVRRFGHSWNTILWAYPFQQGRTNVDLAKKYRKLQQGSAPSPDLITQESAEQRVH
ncbi:telomere repeats-binding bouquet formation protein 1 isoform X4 [Ictalurus punctatus]|uniref:Telomere repeats-binding bouquet formation protein 1 isoform X4 n=1 Tax=Ictalurus punctatus TaxID=7998 RepID=A0A2D0QR71_ICTPU|nr:telomere repeats-binding bouquet formation protein 1 isoform X4 [Ictalurus punctatus]